MTVLVMGFRVLAFVVGAFALVASVLPGVTSQPGHFTRGPGLPMGRAGRIMIAVSGLVFVALALRCGRA